MLIQVYIPAHELLDDEVVYIPSYAYDWEQQVTNTKLKLIQNIICKYENASFFLSYNNLTIERIVFFL